MSGIGFMIDMDGVIYRGDHPIPGALPFLDAFRRFPLLFVTNNSSVTPEQVVEKLEGLGIAGFGAENVLTSAMATAEHLKDLTPEFTYFAVGGPGLHAALSRAGREDLMHPDYVVIGEGKGLDYECLTTGINLLLRGGATLIGTNPDVNLDGTLDGRPVILPGGGALIAPFQVATGMEPLFIGKPNPIIYRMGLRRLGMDAGSVFMIGDRPDTDIRGAAGIGMRTILVTTGRFKRGDPYPADTPFPDLLVDSLAELDLGRLEAMGAVSWG